MPIIYYFFPIDTVLIVAFLHICFVQWCPFHLLTLESLSFPSFIVLLMTGPLKLFWMTLLFYILIFFKINIKLFQKKEERTERQKQRNSETFKERIKGSIHSKNNCLTMWYGTCLTRGGQMSYKSIPLTCLMWHSSGLETVLFS